MKNVVALPGAFKARPGWLEPRLLRRWGDLVFEAIGNEQFYIVTHPNGLRSSRCAWGNSLASRTHRPTPAAMKHWNGS